MGLVVKKWRADSAEQDSDGNFVTIECRQEGIVAFVLNLLGIAPTTTIKVGGERVEFIEGSLEGYNRRVIPLGGVCSTYYGYRRPLKAAIVVAAIAIFVGISVGGNRNMGMVGVIIALLGILAAIIYYLLNRKLAIGLVEMSGWAKGIQFKRSVIEGKRIEEEDARRVCEIVQNVIEARKI